MKKLLSILFAGLLVFNFAGISFAADSSTSAQQTTAKSMQAIPLQQTTTKNNQATNQSTNKVSKFKAEVLLKNARYKVQYFKKNDSVKVLVKNENGPWHLSITKEEAEKRVANFLKNLNISSQTSKQEIVAELSNALGIQPTDVEKVQANVKFENGADFSLQYLKGHNDSNQEHPWKIKDLKLDIKANKDDHLQVMYKTEGYSVSAYVNKKIGDQHQLLRGTEALMEIKKMESAFVPTSSKSPSDYLNNVSNVIGVTPSDITKADIQVQLNNGTKVFVHYKNEENKGKQDKKDNQHKQDKKDNQHKQDKKGNQNKKDNQHKQDKKGDYKQDKKYNKQHNQPIKGNDYKQDEKYNQHKKDMKDKKDQQNHVGHKSH